MNKATTRILIIIIVLALAALACVGGGGDGVDKAGSNDSSLVNQSDVHSPEATATFGAQELHIQLTEIARQTNK